jgi:hypothetical protein
LTRISERNIAAYMAGQVDVLGQASVADGLDTELRSASPGLEARVLRALWALKAGASPNLVARHLDWRDFERFCAALLRARGFDVHENLTLTKPRAQVDILARSSLTSLLVDCKHWARERGPSAVAKAARAQGARAELVRRCFPTLEPLAVVILVLSEEQTRFTEGAAVVPVHTLDDFLSNLPAYAEQLSYH